MNDRSELLHRDATELAALVHAGDLNCRQLTEATLAHIDAVDPRVNAFRVVLAEPARADAARLDALPAADRARLPLAGVPLAIKDDTDVAGQSTLWGTSIDRGACAADAEVVARLRHAGAIVIGKTNVPELTLWPWTASRAGGVTRNPWDTGRTPGGSSGGSAAAVSAGMAALALGSDGGGSVRYPAGLTGLIGLKPQRDRVPLGPEHGNGWNGLIVLGPLTRSVRDAALFLDVVATDPSDRETSHVFRNAVQPESAPSALTIALAVNPPAGSQASVSSWSRGIVDDAAELLSSLGHQVNEVRIDYPLAALRNSTVRLLKGAQSDTRSLPDRGSLERRTRTVARMGHMVPDALLRRALDRGPAVTAPMQQVFENADIVLTPLCESAAPLVKGCPSRGALRSLRASNTSAWLVPWNLAGNPALTVPTGTDEAGLPTAVQLVGRRGDEAALLGLAAQMERARPFPQGVGALRFDDRGDHG